MSNHWNHFYFSAKSLSNEQKTENKAKQNENKAKHSFWQIWKSIDKQQNDTLLEWINSMMKHEQQKKNIQFKYSSNGGKYIFICVCVVLMNKYDAKHWNDVCTQKTSY